MLKVLIADDHEIVRKGLRQILLDEFSLAEIGEAHDTHSLVEKAFTDNWDIIISDLAMPGGGGLEGLSRIRAKLPFQRILILTIYPEDQYAIRVMKSGASGFLNKDTAPEELIKAVNSILQGRRYIQPSVVEKMSESLQAQAGVLSHELLSDSEYGVFQKLAKGDSIPEIADKLSIAENTVSAYRTDILQKMNMHSNADLMKYAAENNIS